MKVKELKNKTVKELSDELQQLLQEQFNLRMQKSLEGGPRSHEFKRVRRNIARVKTILKEKSISHE